MPRPRRRSDQGPNVRTRAAAAAARQKKTIFPFFKLPAELRNEIYELVLQPRQPVRANYRGRFRLHLSPIWRANRQLAREALPMLYGCREFQIDARADLWSYHAGDAHVAFFNAIGPTNMALIRRWALHAWFFELHSFDPVLDNIRQIVGAMGPAFLRRDVRVRLYDKAANMPILVDRMVLFEGYSTMLVDAVKQATGYADLVTADVVLKTLPDWGIDRMYFTLKRLADS